MVRDMNGSDNENIDSSAKSSNADSEQHKSRPRVRASTRVPLEANDA
jgi:hypothetical protein